MTRQIDELDTLINTLNDHGATNLNGTRDSELAELMNAVIRIRQLRVEVAPNPEWRSEVVNQLAQSLRANNGAPTHLETPPIRQEAVTADDRGLALRSWPNDNQNGRFHVTRVRHQIGQMAAAILVLVLVAGLLAVAFESQNPSNGDNSPTAPVGVSGVSVPDTLFATDFDQTTTLTSLLAYRAGSSSFQPVLDVGSPPVISPDGHQLFSGQVTRDADAVHVAVVALSSDTLSRQWRTEVASFPSSKVTTGNLASAGASIAVTADRVYVIPDIWNTRDPITIVVLDRQSGTERARWSIPWTDKNASGGSWIYASPDGATVYVLDTTLDPATNQTTPAVYMRVRASDGYLEDHHELTAPDGQHYFPSGRMTPDSHTLYTVGGWLSSSNGGLELQFFDLTSGTLLPSLELPFQSNGEFLDTEQATSADGRTLYVLSPTVNELAIVDVQSRSVTKTVPIKGLATGSRSLIARIASVVRNWIVQPTAAKFYFSGDMQLSPDGKRLYAVNVTGSGIEATPSGVIAIDTTTGNVVNHWMSDAQINYLQLGGDGFSLYAETSDSRGRWISRCSTPGPALPARLPAIFLDTCNHWLNSINSGTANCRSRAAPVRFPARRSPDST